MGKRGSHSHTVLNSIMEVVQDQQFSNQSVISRIILKLCKNI